MEQMRLTHQTRLFMEVDVEFILQPPETLPDVALPLAVDITGVFITTKTAQDKPRRVNILSALSDSDIINLEDDILTPEFVNNYYKVLEWQKKLS
jgi:hypothetical protein